MGWYSSGSLGAPGHRESTPTHQLFHRPKPSGHEKDELKQENGQRASSSVAQIYRACLSLKVKQVIRRNLPALAILPEYKTAAAYHCGEGQKC